MWAKNLPKVVFLFLVSFSYGQVKIQPPPNELPQLDIPEHERKGIEKKHGSPAPRFEPATPNVPPPPEGTPPPPPPPPKPAINLKDLQNFRTKTFDIKYGQNLAEQKEQTKPQNNHEVSSQGITNNGNANLQEAPKGILLKGHCRLLEDMVVSLEPQQGAVECLVNKKFYRGYMLFVPEVDKYALRAQLVELGGKRISNSEVWTANRRSQNVAAEVDSRLISNILLNTMRTTGRETAEMTKEALKPETSITFPSGASLTIVQQDTKKSLQNIPNFALYSALANLIGTTAEEILADKKRLPPLFKVYRGQEFYFEAEYCKVCQ